MIRLTAVGGFRLVPRAERAGTRAGLPRCFLSRAGPLVDPRAPRARDQAAAPPAVNRIIQIIQITLVIILFACQGHKSSFCQ